MRRFHSLNIPEHTPAIFHLSFYKVPPLPCPFFFPSCHNQLQPTCIWQGGEKMMRTNLAIKKHNFLRQFGASLCFSLSLSLSLCLQYFVYLQVAQESPIVSAKIAFLILSLPDVIKLCVYHWSTTQHENQPIITLVESKSATCIEFHRRLGNFQDCQVKEPKPDHPLVVFFHDPLVDCVLGHPWTSLHSMSQMLKHAELLAFGMDIRAHEHFKNNSWYFHVVSIKALLCKPKLILSQSESCRNWTEAHTCDSPDCSSAGCSLLPNRATAVKRCCGASTKRKVEVYYFCHPPTMKKSTLSCMTCQHCDGLGQLTNCQINAWIQLEFSPSHDHLMTISWQSSHSKTVETKAGRCLRCRSNDQMIKWCQESACPYHIYPGVPLSGVWWN